MADFSGPAFPRPYSTDECAAQCNISFPQEGMSLRDYFAAAALPGVIQSREAPHLEPEYVAAEAYMYADAMLAQRNREADDGS